MEVSKDGWTFLGNTTSDDLTLYIYKGTGDNYMVDIIGGGSRKKRIEHLTLDQIKDSYGDWFDLNEIDLKEGQ